MHMTKYKKEERYRETLGAPFCVFYSFAIVHARYRNSVFVSFLYPLSIFFFLFFFWPGGKSMGGSTGYITHDPIYDNRGPVKRGVFWSKDFTKHLFIDSSLFFSLTKHVGRQIDSSLFVISLLKLISFFLYPFLSLLIPPPRVFYYS